MNVDLFLMAPVMAGQGLIEVENMWSIDNLCDWHEALEIKNEAQEFYTRRAMENVGR